MQTRFEMFKDMIKSAKGPDFSYSAVMRHVRKNSPNKLKQFMKTFKEAFDIGMEDNIPDIEQVALMEAIKTIGLEIQK